MAIRRITIQKNKWLEGSFTVIPEKVCGTFGSAETCLHEKWTTFSVAAAYQKRSGGPISVERCFFHFLHAYHSSKE